MRTSIKVFAAALAMVNMLGSAHAEDQSFKSADRALHRAIAMQGDQALLTIHASAADLISQSIGHQMAVSLPRYSAADDTLHAHPAAGATEVAAVAVNY